MYNPSHSTMLSPLCKRRDFEDEQDLALETSQLLIRSPNNYHGSHKRPRYEPSWSYDNLCSHPCSPLASVDLESIFNMSTFQLLSQEKKQELCSMLPPVDQHMLLNHESLDSYYEPTFFTKSENSYFWDSLSEWQTMLGQGEFMQPESPSSPYSPSPPTSTNNSSKTVCSNRGKSTKSRHNARKDKIKDEVSDPYWGDLIDKDSKAHNVAGDSKSITLKDMCRKGLIRENDVLVYKRNFSACKVIVSKSMTVVKACGLSGISIQLDEEIFEDFETPTALETKILDHHGKVTKDKRPNGNAFKSIRLLRDGKDMGRLFDIRKDGFGDQ